MKIKTILRVLIAVFINNLLFAEIPTINENDIIFEKANSGYDLYIRKLDGINSILLTESQKDPELQKTNYGLQTKFFHPCNGNEKRILNGKILQTQYDINFLVDSTTENHPLLGDSFHYFLPNQVIYGYKWSRQGEITVEPGLRINLRKFSLKYADYSGEFDDQWIILKLSINEDKYRPNLIVQFEELSNLTHSQNKVISDQDDYNKLFYDFIIPNVPIGYDADVVFIIDATKSMKEEIPYFQRQYHDIIEKLTKKVKNLRIGLIFYRDYGERFLTRVYDLNKDLYAVGNLIGQIKIDGGDDVPEALYEAIYELKKLHFQSSNRIVFIIGDAPAHTIPRGKISREDAVKIISDYNIKINTICLPYK